MVTPKGKTGRGEGKRKTTNATHGENVIGPEFRRYLYYLLRGAIVNRTKYC